MNKHKEYAEVDIPMLSVTHGAEFTHLQITLYTVLLFIVTLLPWLTGMNGLTYLSIVLLLNSRFLYLMVKLQLTVSDKIAIRVFLFSITYLMILFAALLADHYVKLFIK